MTKPQRLSERNLRRAICFWWRKLNTVEIAEKLDTCEAAAANSLADWREEEYQKRKLKA